MKRKHVSSAANDVKADVLKHCEGASRIQELLVNWISDSELYPANFMEVLRMSSVRIVMLPMLDV